MRTHQHHISSTASAIADATIAIIAKHGFDAVSVRTVARQVDLAPGTVQHHAHSKDDLLRLALERTVERQLDRIGELPSIRDAFRVAQERLMSLLPLNETRREEAIVWLAFSAAASTRPVLRQAHAEGAARLRRQMRHLLEYAHEVGQAREGISIELGATLLAAQVDGLMLQGANRPALPQQDLLRALDLAIGLLIEPGPSNPL